MNNITILYEDDQSLVINKPAGMMVHPDGTSKDKTLTDWIMEKYPELENIGEEQTLRTGETIKRPGIVHRIDKDTSGVLIIAKTQEAFLHLKEQFQERTVEKVYQAFVYGHFNEVEGIIDRPIGKSKKDFRRWSAQRGARGTLREAVTEYKVLFSAKEVSFVELFPKTGRTHQLRVHMKAINHPLVSDILYAPSHQSLLGFKRLALHAKSVSFNSLSGDRIEIIAPYPEDFEQAVAEIKTMC